MSYLALSVPRTGLEPARLAALAPETSASTIPPPGLCECKVRYLFLDVQVFGEFFEGEIKVGGQCDGHKDRSL